MHDAAVSAEHDKIELHAFERLLGSVFDDKIHSAMIFRALDSIKLDENLALDCAYGQWDEHLQHDASNKDAPHL
jgi:hypothetical protein